MDLLVKRSWDKDLRTAAVTAAGILCFALLTGAGSFIRIPLPFSPAPITLQTFFVLSAGMLLGGGAGSASQFLYLVFGAAGFSVFSCGGAGALYFCGPTGGYLPGFVLAALISGAVARRAHSFAGVLCGCLAGSAIILACGAIWLSFVTGISFRAAAAAGALPFIPGDILKSLAAAAVFCRFKKAQ